MGTVDDKVAPVTGAVSKGRVRLLFGFVAKKCSGGVNNVRVNSIHPGIIDTAIWDKMGLPAAAGANRIDVGAIAATTLPGQAGPADIADGALFPAPDDSYVNGGEFVIDRSFSS